MSDAHLPMFDAAARDTLEIDRLRRQREYWRGIVADSLTTGRAGAMTSSWQAADRLADMDAGEPR